MIWSQVRKRQQKLLKASKFTPKINQIIIKETQKILRDCSRPNQIRATFRQLFQIRGPQQASTDKTSREKARPFQDQQPMSHLKLTRLETFRIKLEMWAQSWEIWDMGLDLRTSFQVYLQLLNRGLRMADLGSVLDAKIFQLEDHRLSRQIKATLPSNNLPMLQAVELCNHRTTTQTRQTWLTSLKVTPSTFLCALSTSCMLHHTQIKQKTLCKVIRAKMRNLKHRWSRNGSNSWAYPRRALLLPLLTKTW